MIVTHRLHLFGHVALERIDQPAWRFPTRKAMALLGYLVRQAHPVPRTELTDLLWGDLPDARSRRNLTRELSQLAAQLPNCFQADYHTIRWAPPAPVWVDTTAFLDLLAPAGAAPTRKASTPRQTASAAWFDRPGAATVDSVRLAAAVALYRGEFMAGLYLDGCPDFETWLTREREFWRRQVMEQLELLSAHHALHQQDSEAVVFARRCLELEPWHEQAHSALMILLARTGKRNDALAQYEACRRVLADELGVTPAEETTALYEQIRTNQLPIADCRLQIEPNNLQSTIYNRQSQDWGTAPQVESFYGRQAELAALQRWLAEERCRLVAILGMGGMGKTVLASQAARLNARHYDVVIWRSLLNAPPLTELLRGCIPFLSAREIVDPPRRLDDQITLLLDLFGRRRCLFILDNCESILQAGARAGAYRPGYKEYGQLIRHVGEGAHQSCLLLTSREQPQEFALLQGARSAIRSLHLVGLDAAAGREILRSRDLADPEQGTERLIARYSGNPLALHIVAETVKDLFGGEVAAFLREETLIFDDIRDVLNQQWDRLTMLEQDILLWLAIEREALTPETLRANLLGGSPAQALLEALRSLRRRSLIEQHEAGFTLQNVVMEYATDRLIALVCQEVETGAWRRFCSHALIKAQAHEYVRESLVRLILTPIAERLITQFGRTGLERRLYTGLATLREQAPRAPGYAGGNLLNLLIHLKYGLRGYDFSGVSIWQADLRGAWLPDVCFQSADLTGTLFTDAVRAVELVVFSPDGALLAAATDDGEIRLWRTVDRQMVGVCVGHRGIVWSLCFSPDGRYIASGAEDRTIYIWDAGTQQIRHALQGHSASISFIAWSADGATIASAGGWDRTVRLWDARSGAAVGILELPTRFVSSVAFSPDGALLACSDWDGQITLWERQSQRRICGLSCGSQVGPLSFNATGTLLAAAVDRSVWLWDVGAAALLGTIDCAESSIRYLACSPTAPTLAIAVGRIVWLCDERTGAILQTLQGHTDQIRSCAWRRDGAVLVTWGDETVRVWDARTGNNLASVRGFSAAVECVAVSPAGDHLVSCSSNGRIYRWDAATGQLHDMLYGHSGAVQSIVFSPNGSVFASAGTDHTITIWDTNSGRALRTLHAHDDAIHSLAFSPDGRLLASGGEDSDIRIWDVTSGQVRHVLRGHTANVWSMACSPNDMILASGGHDRTVRLWHAETGQPLAVLNDHQDSVTAVTFDPTGRYVVSAGLDRIVCWWDMRTKHAEHRSWQAPSHVQHIAFSQDGTTLLVCCYDRMVYVCDADSGEVAQRLGEHHGWVLSLAWLADSSRFVSGGSDGTVRVWDARSGACLRVLRAPGPYAGMNISGATGVTEAQRAALRALGAVE